MSNTSPPLTKNFFVSWETKSDSKLLPRAGVYNFGEVIHWTTEVWGLTASLADEHTGSLEGKVYDGDFYDAHAVLSLMKP